MSTRKKALVGNAADRDQVRRGAEQERFTREAEIADMRLILALPAGRRLLWHLLSQAKVYESVMDSEAMRVAYNAGRQDFGHFVIAEILEANPEAWLQMHREASQAYANTVEPAAPDPTIDPTTDDDT